MSGDADHRADPAAAGPAALQASLQQVWRNEPGLKGQLTAVNHTTVGLRFIFTGIAFLLVGGILSMFMRLQLAWSDQQVLDHELYNQFVTMHGTTMMFLFAVPVMEGFALYLIPKMIGARDMPYPRMTAFGYWCYLFGGLFLYASFLFGAAPDGGWFMYTPLTGREYSPGLGPDFWLLGVTFAEIAAVTAAIELIVNMILLTLLVAELQIHTRPTRAIRYSKRYSSSPTTVDLTFAPMVERYSQGLSLVGRF